MGGGEPGFGGSLARVDEGGKHQQGYKNRGVTAPTNREWKNRPENCKREKVDENRIKKRKKKRKQR